MPTALVYATAGGDRDFLFGALANAGYDAFLPSDRGEAGEGSAPEVVVADLGVAVEMGWVRTSAPTLAPGPLVLCSRFAEFLERLRSRVSAVLRLPASEQDLRRAIVRARSGQSDRSESAVDTLDRARDARLSALGLFRSGAEPEFSGIADLVARAVGVKVGLVTLIDSTWQSFLGASGLDADLAAAQGTPRSWSFCQHVVRDGAPLIVPDARAHPVLGETPLVELGLVASYVGYPIELAGLGTVGSVCAIGDAARVFSSTELASVQLAARLVSEILSRRARLPVPPPTDPEPGAGELGPGSLLDDKYWITARLGEGGQGRVFLGRERAFGRMVAIKVPLPKHQAALLREAETMGKLRHRNIVQLHGWGTTPAGETYLVLEYVEGESLAEHVDRLTDVGEWVPPARVADIVAQLAGALASMHALGYVHGDVKPENVLLDATLDRAVLVDFGLGLEPGMRSRGRGFGGTVGYSAPEQLLPEGELFVGPEFDVYGLAAVAFRLLTGVGPFEAHRVEGLLGRQMRGQMNSLSLARPGLPAAVGELLGRALSASPAARPPSTLALSEALRAALGSAPDRAPGPSGEPREGREARSRGGVFRELREQGRRSLGVEAERRLVDGLPSAHARAMAEAVDDAALYPTAPLLGYLAALTGGDRARLEALGERLVGEGMQGAIRSLHLARTPWALVGAVPVLLGRGHSFGEASVRRVDSNRAQIELTLEPGLAPVMCALVGGTVRGLLATTSQRGEVTHEACQALGAPSCRLAVRWEPDR